MNKNDLSCNVEVKYLGTDSPSQLNSCAFKCRHLYSYISCLICTNFLQGNIKLQNMHFQMVLFGIDLVSILVPKKASFAMPNLHFFGAYKVKVICIFLLD